MNEYKGVRYSYVLCLITGLSVMFAVAANIVSANLKIFPGLSWFGCLPLGVFFFPFIYILSDITSDVYGYRISRYIAWTTLALQLVIALGILAITYFPTTPDFMEDFNLSLRVIFKAAPRVTIAGAIGAVLGGWSNDIVFQVLRHKDGTGKFLKRKLFSSVVAEIVDTTIFITLAFAFTPAWGFKMYLGQFLMKYAVEVITSPLAKVGARKLREYEGLEVFEDRSKFNIFGFEKH